MQLLSATEQHYPAIAALVSSPEELYQVYPGGQFPWDIDQLRALARSRSDFTVALENNKVIAFANLYNVYPKKSAYIGNIVVAQSHRGKGIGKALTTHMIGLCQTTYDAVAHLSVFNFNTSALLMYSAQGFTPYAVEKRLDLTGEPVALIHMRFEANR